MCICSESTGIQTDKDVSTHIFSVRFLCFFTPVVSNYQDVDCSNRSITFTGTEEIFTERVRPSDVDAAMLLKRFIMWFGNIETFSLMHIY